LAEPPRDGRQRILNATVPIVSRNCRARFEGQGVSALANPGATLLMLAFGPTRMRSVVGGVSRTEVEAAFPGWEMLSVEPAETRGLGWPMNKTAPQWYRLRRETQ
jgi:hypothetical protein